MSRSERALRELLRYRIGHLPLWVIRFLDAGRYSARRLSISKRYPLADRADSLSCQPFFIISAGRSGTTLLRSMLVAGGQIAIPPETQVIPAAVRRFLSLQHLGWTDLSRLIVALFESRALFSLWEINLYPAYQATVHLPETERSLARVIDEVIKLYATQHFPEAGIWGDQSPINTLYLPWVRRTFPQAKYLHLLRDGRDAISSMVGTGRTDLARATERWVISVKYALRLQNRLGPDQFLEVRYEDLVSEPAKSLKRICTFVGIDYHTQMLDYWKLPTTIEHKHFDYHRNIGRPVFTSSIGGWAERLSSEEQEYVLLKTSDLLQRFGYKS
jgi:protein-tyrosine sulfotransferase